MKKNILIVGLLIIAQSCTINDTNELNSKTTESWELVSINENITTSQTNNHLNIHEQLVLLNDSLFSRTRQSNSNFWRLNGTYNYMIVNGTKYIVFQYNEKSSIIGNCSKNLNEVFVFESENRISNTWYECGGPKLIYHKN
ncbi:hypothetical protein [Pontimicrobium sp. SW4]|uniref:Lipocalin-like domain-containing protein n=1 Tax=Pontimicrobium sp. SW4 TaxID=3153519 RepID=A0AAU7BQ77_9FLAO